MNINTVANKIVENISGGISKNAKKTSGVVSQVIYRNLSDGAEVLAEQNKVFVRNLSDFSREIEDKKNYLKKIATSVSDEVATLSNGNKINLKVYEGTQFGSNNGAFVLNQETNELFYMKVGGKQSAREVLASRIYKEAGLNVPEMEIVTLPNGQTGLLSKYIPNLSPIRNPQQSINDGFAMDAFLANWDSVCSDNAQIAQGKLYRIDFGGTLVCRVRGEIKDSFYSGVVDDLITLIDPQINPTSANLFSSMTRSDLINSLKKVVNLDEENLEKLVLEYAPGDSYQIYNILLKRKEFLTYILEYIENNPTNNKSMQEYLQCAKNYVLTTPLTEFKAYKLKHPEIKSSKLFSFSFKRKSNIEQTKQKMMAHRSNIFKNHYFSFDPEEFVIGIKKGDFGISNSVLRSSNGANGSVEKMEDIMQYSALPESVVLWRGGSPFDFGSVAGNISSDKLYDKLYKKGDCIRFPIYLHTSLDENIGKKFAETNNGFNKNTLYKINAPKGTQGLYLDGLCDEFADEEEVLLSRNLVYRFKNRTPYFKYDLIELDVVNDADGVIDVKESLSALSKDEIERIFR